MTASVHDGPAARPSSPGGRARRWVVLLLAISQVVTTAVVFGGGAGALSSDASDPTLTPAGYAFTIWTVPLLSCLAYAVHAWGRRGSQPYRSTAWPLAVTMVGFDVWLWCAARGWVWATVVVFAGMLVALATALRASHRHPADTPAGRVIIAVTLGVYAGWTTVAVWANLAAALHDDGRGLSDADTGWQLALLVAAGASAVVGVWLTRAELAYLVSVLWGLVAVVVGTAQRGHPGWSSRRSRRSSRSWRRPWCDGGAAGRTPNPSAPDPDPDLLALAASAVARDALVPLGVLGRRPDPRAPGGGGPGGGDPAQDVAPRRGREGREAGRGRCGRSGPARRSRPQGSQARAAHHL